MDFIKVIADEFGIKETQSKNVIELIDDGNTIPFIARYRKEMTGSLDDQVIRQIFERLTYLRNLEKRKEEVLSSIEEQGKLTDEIREALEKAETMTEVEDIYRPYKPHRKTRASVAREKGLEPLAELIFAQEVKEGDPADFAAEYINEEKGVETAEDAIAGACDIIAEDISDNAEFRQTLRSLIFDNGMITSKANTEEDTVYRMYYEYSEAVKKIPGHRVLALNRGEKEDILKVSVEIDEYLPLSFLINRNVIPGSIFTPLVDAAVRDSYSRLIFPSIEREIRSMLFDTASESAIVVFEDNLKHLLLQPPLKGKTVIGFDPGYRTGCKLAVVDKTGKVLDTAVIYPTKPQERIEESEKIMLSLIKKYDVDVISIGNGTASKESEMFVAGMIKNNGLKTKYIVTSEAGASVYSASELAAKEFPDFDVTQRSAVSIARRIQDPLAELVKIEPKAIGVGQYQHDMKPQRLDEALGGVVESCVNSVGVNLNTASFALLSYVAGINSTSAKNIVKYREENGEFESVDKIKKVPRVGDKAFEQCAGFLRLPDSNEPLDNTGVHPESYGAAKKLMELFGFELVKGDIKGLAGLSDKVKGYGKEKLAEELAIGVPTLDDIVRELEKPGLDIRDDFEQPVLRDDILDMNDLYEGMVLTGTVRNVCDFGAFVDIGVHQDGLVHISQISDKYIKHPSEALSVGDIVKVSVISVDVKTKRIGLTMKGVK
ncbi:MAG: RNA-binding transcriptional accessory protein [Ruminococcaceae bacterium]|nr:RNA-binding transcriptional accessory protein [Oscillospiraceae bacterium]